MRRIALTFTVLALVITPAGARTTRTPLHGGTVFTPTRTGKGSTTGQLDYHLSRSHSPLGGVTWETGDPENPSHMLRITIPF